MRDDLTALLRTIDPPLLGARLRAARDRASLTQAQVANGLVSVGYVSRIESGQRRPDPELLTVLADRLAVGVDELLIGVTTDVVAELEVQLDHAELALVTGSPRAALDDVTAVLADAGLVPLPTLRRRAEYLHAAALESNGDLQAAILRLEDLTEVPPFDLAWIDGQTALCRCYRESGELGRAIEVGTAATHRIEELGLDGLDESIRLSLTLAAAHFERGDAAFASRLCRRAMDRAEELDSPVVKAMAYWNSSAMESRRGNAAGALPLARRALAVVEAADDARNTGRLRTQLGLLQLMIDPPQPRQALSVLVHAEGELRTTDAGAADLADNRLGQARARFLLGEVDVAQRLAEQTARDAGADAPMVAAEAYALLGAVAIGGGHREQARSHVQQAVMLLSGFGADREAAQQWFELAGLLESIGDGAAALDAYRRAGAASGLIASNQRAVVAAPTFTDVV